MPGQVRLLSVDRATGWATHPDQPDYPVLVHMAHRSVIVRSIVADQVAPHGVREEEGPHGFTLDLAGLGMRAGDLRSLHFMVGETDEALDLPESLPPRPAGALTVEDILGEAHSRRAWVTGKTYLEAAEAGLRAETIVDMLYRDYLGRPGDPNGLEFYSTSVERGAITYDDIRRGFADSDEYRMRRKYVSDAPGSIFSQRIVLSAASRDAKTQSLAAATRQQVSAAELVALDDAPFIAACYRRILRKEVDPAGMSHYLNQLRGGTSKMAVVRHLARELEAVTAGVWLVDLDEAA